MNSGSSLKVSRTRRHGLRDSFCAAELGRAGASAGLTPRVGWGWRGEENDASFNRRSAFGANAAAVPTAARTADPGPGTAATDAGASRAAAGSVLATVG